jgi:hypothetical protein
MNLPPNLKQTKVDLNSLSARYPNPNASEARPVEKSYTEKYIELLGRNTFDPNSKAKEATANTSDAETPKNTNEYTDDKLLLKGLIIFVVIIVVISLILYVVKRQKEKQAEYKAKDYEGNQTMRVLNSFRTADFSRNVVIVGEILVYLIGMIGIVKAINMLVKASCETV